MLMLVESTVDKRRLEARLRQEFKKKYRRLGERIIGYQGGQLRACLFSKGQGEVWAAFLEPSNEEKTPKYWNGLGLYEVNSGLQVLTVELNVPVKDNSERVSGYFAKNAATGDFYLMHSGKVGGGKPGVGKTTFLGWYKEPLITVLDSKGNARTGIGVARFGASSFTADVERFVRNVAAFKALASQQKLNFDDLKNEFKDLDLDSSEFWGEKKGARSNIIDYVTHHGKVVDELRIWRKQTASPDEVVTRTALMDLLVRKGGRLIEVYEVKTAVDRSSLYTALGQLIVHSGGVGKVAKYLVIPEGSAVPSDIAKAIGNLSVSVVRYSLNDRGDVRITS